MSAPFQPSDTSNIFVSDWIFLPSLEEPIEETERREDLRGINPAEEVNALSTIAESAAIYGQQTEYTTGGEALLQPWTWELDHVAPYVGGNDDDGCTIASPEPAPNEQLFVNGLAGSTFRSVADEPWNHLTYHNDPTHMIRGAAASEFLDFDAYLVERDVDAPARSEPVEDDVEMPERLSSVTSRITPDQESPAPGATSLLQLDPIHYNCQGPPPNAAPNSRIRIPRLTPACNDSQTTSTASLHQCPDCGLICSRPDVVERHKSAQHPPSDSRVLLCTADNCGQQWALKREDKMRQHCRDRHGHQSGHEQFISVPRGCVKWPYQGRTLFPTPKRSRARNNSSSRTG